MFCSIDSQLISELCQILMTINTHAHTSTRSSRSHTRKTKQLLARDCGTKRMWVLSRSRLRTLQFWRPNWSPEGGLRTLSTYIFEVRWEPFHTGLWHSWTELFPHANDKHFRAVKSKHAAAETPSKHKTQPGRVYPLSNQGRTGAGKLPWFSRKRKRKDFCVPSLPL